MLCQIEERSTTSTCTLYAEEPKRDELAELEADLAANDKGGEGEAQDEAQAA